MDSFKKLINHLNVNRKKVYLPLDKFDLFKHFIWIFAGAEPRSTHSSLADCAAKSTELVMATSSAPSRH